MLRRFYGVFLCMGVYGDWRILLWVGVDPLDWLTLGRGILPGSLGWDCVMGMVG